MVFFMPVVLSYAYTDTEILPLVLSNTDNELLSKDLDRAARELSDAPSVTSICDTTYAKKKLAPTSRPL